MAEYFIFFTSFTHGSTQKKVGKNKLIMKLTFVTKNIQKVKVIKAF